LCRAVADALEARFNPVTVQGELSGFTRASSGHCYFSLKDSQAQIRCVMFKRVSGMLDFSPRDGQLVELRGRVSLYEPRGDLQLMVESMRQAGAGALFEQFLQLKARLEGEGLFDAGRKRALPLLPRGIGVVTSLGAAALRDVISTLRRRAPHVPVVVAAAPVQGAGAPAELVLALGRLYALAGAPAHGAREASVPPIDVILLVRGGGSMEDLWAFNDESLARTIVRSPVPVVCGVGHETDFTIADFVADVRAPTPTAAAELVATSREAWLDSLASAQTRLRELVWRRLDMQSQKVDALAARFGRPSSMAAAQRFRLSSLGGRMHQAVRTGLERKDQQLQQVHRQMPLQIQRGLERRRHRLLRAQAQLALLDPMLVLQRGYAWLVDEAGRTITDPAQTHAGQQLRATLAAGTLDLLVPRQV
jgi:exodeoxyribonuclease VII large subunit